MTQDGIDKMFAAWEVVAPKTLTEGWHGSLRSCCDEEGSFISSPIEGYDEDGLIHQIGAATVRGGVYSETIW